MNVSAPRHKALLVQVARQNIVDAVTRIIAADGMQGFSMDRVAAEAGVPEGTLYRYFTTKSALVRDTVDHCLIPMQDELLETLAGGGPPDARLAEMIQRHLGFFERHRSFFRVLLYDRTLAQSKAARYKNSRFRQLIERTAAVVEEGVQAGLFRPLDPLKVATVILEADIAMIGRRLVCEDPGPVEDDAVLLRDMLIHGIGQSGPEDRQGQR